MEKAIHYKPEIAYNRKPKSLLFILEFILEFILQYRSSNYLCHWVIFKSLMKASKQSIIFYSND